MSPSSLFRAPVLAALLFAPCAAAKPIAFQDGRTLMVEYGAGTMQEVQGFYAPDYRYSIGGGYLRIDDEDETFRRDITYLRLNVLAKRWNLSAAQGNVFLWGGIGGARGGEFEDTRAAENAGAQFDYETLRVYTSVKTDYQHSSAFSHRIDTLQLGVAPYRHRYSGMATWVVAQARGYTGDIYSGAELALVLRLFRGPVWVEAGATADGNFQSMFMFNF